MVYCRTGDRKLCWSRKQQYCPYCLSKLSSFGTGASLHFHGAPLVAAVHNKTLTENIDTSIHLNKITFFLKNGWNLLRHERGIFYTVFPAHTIEKWAMLRKIYIYFFWMDLI